MTGGEAATTSEESATALETSRFPVVAIGASAGGLDAFQAFLQALPADTGMAFVLVAHLPAAHHSMLSEILARSTAMPVTEARDRLRLEPDHVYVLPAGADVDVRSGELLVSAREAPTGRHHPIDRVLHSLAEDAGSKAIGVILSGTASDGTLGIQEIKTAGGITFAQDDSAQHTSMPRSAIATDAVDFVLAPAAIARELGRIADHPLVAAKTPAPSEEALDLNPIFDVLREASGVDFSHYKRNTLYRRIARRIVLHKLENLAEYLEMLRADATEAQALYHDILINVTSFFRDPEAFDALKADVFPKLAENRSRHDAVRMWVLGCSTGEEAYSLAMEFAEFCDSAGRTLPLQIFATDLSGPSIDRARLGVYSRSAVQSLTPQRLKRFFVEADGSYRVAKQIRDQCVFARHNALADPPFSRVDFVSCRNLLIYLDTDLQRKLVPLMHFALRPAGYLWLGTSETTGEHRELFEVKHARHKIYMKKGGPARLPERAMSPSRAAVVTAGNALRLTDVAATVEASQKDVDRLLVARYAPPSVLIRSDLEILQFRGDTSRYFAPAPGRASLNLLKMVREELVMGVRAAVQSAQSKEAPARQEGLRVKLDGQVCEIAIEVIPVRTSLDRAELFMVVFEETARAAPLPQTTQPGDSADADAATQEIVRLQQELAATREYLQSVIEQLEGANEELQSANEEVQSTNEELQSINEELETSKEELQSSNEELSTVNDELLARNTELAQSNNDFLNLLCSVQMPIVMLDARLRIRRFTPAAEKLLNLLHTDVGRPLSDIKLKFDVRDIDAMIKEVFDTMSSREREVQDDRGCWFLLRVRPYRTIENRIDGAVIALIDVDTLKRSQDSLRQQTELLNQAHEPIVMWEIGGTISYWNRAAEETYGYTAEQAANRELHELLEVTPPLESYRPQLEREGHWTGELVHTRRDGQKIIVESRMVVAGSANGRKLVVEANRPITERKKSETLLRRLADDLVTADRHKDEFLAMLAHELRNPLAPLRNVVAVLKSAGVATPDKTRALDMMDRQVSNMTRLVDDLLDVSRITLSQIELRKESVDVAAAVQRVAEQNAPQVRAREQTLDLELADTPVLVHGDPVRIEQIVGNLLDNASKYTAQGGRITIAVDAPAESASAAADERQVVIRVQDNGIGIPAEKLPHVFDLFMRATRSVDHQYGGLGIGLTLVRRLTELHGGSVAARSEGPGRGSEFIVRLPAITSASSAASTGQARSLEALTRKQRILIVDDNVDNAESLALTLRLSRQEVQVAASGIEALELARRFSPEACLIDIGMPHMDGCELARRLRELPATRSVRLIALSGYGQEDAKQRARDAGFDAYLVKPASADAIARALEPD